RENDATGLYYYRARYYHTTLQRFISEDPIEFGGRDLNSYAFVNNNSINRVDPLGLYTSARWIQQPHLSGVKAEFAGTMGVGEYWTLLPPAIGISGEWWMITGTIKGVVECIEEGDCGE